MPLMASVSEIRTRLAAIDAILNAGVTQTSVDGVSNSFNHDTLRRERATLQQQIGTKKKRNRVFNLNMGGR